MTENLNQSPPWMKTVLLCAGVYNLLWGCWVVCYPGMMFDWLNMEAPRYPQIWQCVGMVVGVYGVGYLIAATDPFRHWPIILVGFLGKLFGPIGFVSAALKEELPWGMGWLNVFNDLIWLIPFGLILWRVYQSREETP